MLRRDNSNQVDTVLGKDTDFNGVIHANKSLRIEGRFTGKIFTKGNIVVGRKALIKGDINSRNAMVTGEVRGNIYCTGCLEISKYGRVYGDLNVGTLKIEDGAVFKGSSEMRANVVQVQGRRGPQPQQISQSAQHPSVTGYDEGQHQLINQAGEPYQR